MTTPQLPVGPVISRVTVKLKDREASFVVTFNLDPQGLVQTHLTVVMVGTEPLNLGVPLPIAFPSTEPATAVLEEIAQWVNHKIDKLELCGAPVNQNS